MVQPLGSRQERIRWAGSPQGVAPHAHRGVVGAPELCRRLVASLTPRKNKSVYTITLTSTHLSGKSAVTGCVNYVIVEEMRRRFKDVWALTDDGKVRGLFQFPILSRSDFTTVLKDVILWLFYFCACHFPTLRCRVIGSLSVGNCKRWISHYIVCQLCLIPLFGHNSSGKKSWGHTLWSA